MLPSTIRKKKKKKVKSAVSQNSDLGAVLNNFAGKVKHSIKRLRIKYSGEIKLLVKTLIAPL